MCGIIYYRGPDAPLKVMRQYRKQHNRGREGFGWINIKAKPERRRFKGELMTMFQLGKLQSKELMFHHRFPTSTDNEKSCNHPIGNISDYKLNYYLVHNGIISNAGALFKEHQKLGLNYETIMTGKTMSFNDSECLLHELALYLEGRKKKIGTMGSVAFMLEVTDKNNNHLYTYFGRNESNPLKISKDNCMIASELKKGTDIQTNMLFKIQNGEITSKPLKIGKTFQYQSSYPIYHQSRQSSIYDDYGYDDYPMGYNLQDTQVYKGNDEITNFRKSLIQAWSTADVAKLNLLKSQIPSLEQKHSRDYRDHDAWRDMKDEVEGYIEAINY